MVNGLTANTEPGAALAGFSESLLAVTLIFLPSCIKNAIGMFIPRTQLWMWAAGWVKSNCAISLVRDGALVARDSSCFFGVSFPASIWAGLNQRFGTNRTYAVKQLAAGHVRVNRNRLHIQNIAGIQPFVQLHNSHAGFGIAVQHGPLDGGGTTVLG